MGHSLKSRIHRRALVSTQKTSHQSFRTEVSFSGCTILQKELQQQFSPHSLKQTGQNKISRPMCTDLKNSHLVPQQQGNTQSKAHTGLTKCHREQPLQEEPDPVNRVVPFSSDIQESLQNMGETTSGPVCNQPEQKAPSLCLSDSRPSGLGSRCPNIPWENLVAYTFPPTALLPKVIQKLQSQVCRIILIAPGWSTKPWFWDLVEMSLDIPRQLPPIRTLLKQPLNNHYHANPSSLNLHAWYLGVQEDGFNGEVAERIADSQLGTSTLLSGQSFKDGAQKNRWTSGIPL